MIRRTAALGAALGLCASLLVAPPSSGAEPLAPERYNSFVLTGGQAASPWDIPRDKAALSDHAAFRVWSGYGESFVRSTTDLSRKGLEAFDWPRAETMPYNQYASSFAASAEGNYLVLATASSEAGSLPARIHVQVVPAGATAVSSDREVPLSLVGGLVNTVARVGVAATGSDIYVVGSSGSALTGDYRLQLLRSADRGRTWSPPVDLPAVAGFTAPPGIPTPRVEADGPHLAVYLDKSARYTDPGRRTVLRSDDGGQTWTELGDPEPTTSGSAVGIGWRDGVLRAAWTVQSGDHVALRTSVNVAGSPWSAPEDLPDDGLGATSSPLAPVVHELGSTWAIQAPGGLLRTRWAAGWLRPHEVNLRQPPIAIGGDRVLYEDFAYLPDLLPPQVGVTWGHPFTPYQYSTQQTGIGVTDEGGLQSVQCWLDGRVQSETSATNPYCGTRSGGHLPEGPHAIRVLATDWAGRTTDHTVRWTTDTTAPTVRWTHPPTRWVRAGQRVRWSWRTTDALSGIAATSVQTKVGTSRYATHLRTWRRAPHTRAVTVPAGMTACVSVWTADRVDNVADDLRCSTAPIDDLELGTGELRYQVAGRVYAGHRATVLTDSNRLAFEVSTQRRVTGLAVRALTCPSCGTLRVRAGGRTYRLDLRADGAAVRTVAVPMRRQLRGPDVRLTRAGHGRVIVDGVYTETSPF